MTGPLRLAVLGLGKAGLRHLEAARASEVVELVAAADNSAEVRARIEKETTCPVVENLDKLLTEKPQAVVVALPHGSLVDAALRVCEAGLHLLLEKPIANSLAQARLVVQAAEAAKVELMVNYNHRFREEYQIAKRLVADGRIGRPCLLVEQMFAAPGPLPEWVWDPKVAGGGMMTYNGSHILDHLIWLADQRVESVVASTANFHYSKQLEDTTVATLRFIDGSIGSIVQHKSAIPHNLPRWETRIHGTEGVLRVVAGRGVYVSGPNGDERFHTGEDHRFITALSELAGALREKRAPQPDGHSAVRVLACLEALYRSARERKWVTVETSSA